VVGRRVRGLRGAPADDGGDGTNPSTLVFVAVAVLVALGAVSAAVNSGLVPTTLLVAAPVFGATVTRYGTEVRYSWGTGVVSLPDAVAVAAAVAAVFGVPLAVCGFLLGAGLKHAVVWSHASPR
jgi:hypothetical protein